MADSARDESFNESHSGRGKGVRNEERVRQRKKKSGRQRERRVPYSGEKCPAVEKKVPGRRIGSFLYWDTLDRQGRRKCRRDWMGSGGYDWGLLDRHTLDRISMCGLEWDALDWETLD